MAALAGVLGEDLSSVINTSPILVVGAGGIGCELLKNLVLSGFNNIHIIDLDTIDVSNLNRQFLFQKQHVGKSKSAVAKETALKFNPDVNITSHHDSIMNMEYGVNYFKQFVVVMNALDNRAARSHVNRMCLAARVPLIESGSAGYLGQVTVISRGEYECYDCQPKSAQKSYPGCTIRNTPSEPVHCIVWSKHLFNQLFGEEDPDEDVSPDTEDPELAGDAGTSALSSTATAAGNVSRTSTRVWAQQHNYNPEKLFTKLFHDDINYLLSMDKLWKKRRPPTPLTWQGLADQGSSGGSNGSSSGGSNGSSTTPAAATSGLRDQQQWTVLECRDILSSSCASLRTRLSKLPPGDHLVWDKDDQDSMDFVAACSNIRAHIFNIKENTRFTIKSMAGNIIPAIATTNAVIAGLIVIEALKILQKRKEDCRTVVLNKKPNARGRLLMPIMLEKPNPKCYVCSDKPEISVRLNATTTTILTLQDKILKAALHMVAPDVEIDDGKGTVIISSEEGETEDNLPKLLKDFNIRDGTILKCDDFLQDYKLDVTIIHSEEIAEGCEFEIVGDASSLGAKEPEAETEEKQNGGDVNMNNGDSHQETTVDDDDDLMIVAADADVQPSPTRKRRSSHGEDSVPSKRPRTEIQDDDVAILIE